MAIKARRKKGKNENREEMSEENCENSKTILSVHNRIEFIALRF